MARSDEIGATRSKVVIHVAESYASGVASAIRDYVSNSPGVEHHLVYAERNDAPVAESELTGFTTAVRLPFGHVSRILWLRKHLRSQRGAIIHAHSSLAGGYVRLAVRSSRSSPVVYTPHCYASERTDLSAVTRHSLRLVEWVLSANTAVYAACSKREATLSQWSLSRAKVVFVPNVPPLGAGLHRDPGPRSSVLQVVGAGRLGPQKDAKYFARTVSSLRGAGYVFDARWIGGGDLQLVRMLESEGIEVTGWQSRESGLALLANADVYVHTAAWEGFPMAILEAVALGVPVVARSIVALNGVDLPLLIDAPEDAIPIWEQIEDPVFRLDALSRCHVALAFNSGEHQFVALSEVYQLEATGRIVTKTT